MFSLHIPLIAILLAWHVCAEDTYYAIWPKDSSDFETNNKIRDDLNGKVGVDKIYASESATIGFLYWYQQLNAELLDHYSKFPGVSSLLHDPFSTQERRGIVLGLIET